jgi:hypothetical protein
MLFVVGPLGLQRSDDAGGSFRVAVPAVTAAVLAPRAGASSADVLVGSVPLAVYHSSSGLLTAGPSLPAGITAVKDAAYAGDIDHLVVSAWQADPAAPGQQRAVLLSCTATACRSQVQFDGPYTIHLNAVPSATPSRTVAAYWDAGALLSDDGGLVYRSLPWSVRGALVSVALDPAYASTRHIIAGALGTTAPAGSLLYTSNDGGSTFAATPTTGLPARLALAQIVVLPDGRALAALTSPDDTGDFGLRCSSDGGRTWYSSCGAR